MNYSSDVLHENDWNIMLQIAKAISDELKKEVTVGYAGINPTKGEGGDKLLMTHFRNGRQIGNVSICPLFSSDPIMIVYGIVLKERERRMAPVETRGRNDGRDRC